MIAVSVVFGRFQDFDVSNVVRKFRFKFNDVFDDVKEINVNLCQFVDFFQRKSSSERFCNVENAIILHVEKLVFNLIVTGITRFLADKILFIDFK